MSTNSVYDAGPDRRIQRIVDALTVNKGIHHAILAIESGDRSYRRVFVSGEANPDGTPMRPQTPFFAASITKLFIAAAVLKLVERGEVGLSASIVEYLPRKVTDGLHRLNGVDYTEQVTVSHLLRHMSGLPDWLEDRAKGRLPLIDRLFAGNDRSFDVEAIAAVVRDELTPHFPPQDLNAPKPLVRYSDTGFQLLMAIIEAVTGRRLPDIYRQEIFEPLGMRTTWLPECPPEHTPIAPSTLWVGEHPLELPLALNSIRDIYSTTADLILFLRALVSGTLFESPQTAETMYDGFRRFSRFWDRSAFRQPPSLIEYGAGMMRFALPRVLTPMRRIPAVIGHSGSTGTWLFYCRELDLYLAGCVDQAGAASLPFRLVPRVLHEVTSAHFTPPGFRSAEA